MCCVLHRRIKYVYLSFTSYYNGCYFISAETTDVPKDVVVIRSLDGFSMNISWTPITLAKARGFPLYVITYSPLSSHKHAAMQASTNESYVVISGLDPSQSYSVVISVQTSGGSVSSNASVTSLSPILTGNICIHLPFAPLLGLALCTFISFTIHCMVNCCYK